MSMIAYLDMPSGISGDMFLGCLLDAGWPLDALHTVIASLGLPPDAWSIQVASVMRGSQRATLAQVEAREEKTHRHLSDIQRIIDQSTLSPTIKSRSIAVFTRLAQAEALVHGTSVEAIHFHEVGALDAIIDIVGVCAGLEALGISQLYASGAPLGEGWTNSAHGRIPLPAPATLALLTAVQAPNRPAPGPGELVTPTGAALIAELARFKQPVMNLQRIGLGAGRKEFAWPNIARLWLGQPTEDSTPPLAPRPSLPQNFVILETNIDDMNPELYTMVTQQLFTAGALDVWTTPIQMKKGRPAVQLSLIAPIALEQTLANLIMNETTTLGVRAYYVHRHEAQRQMATVATPYGEVEVKLKQVEGRLVGAKPEYESCQRLAQAQQVPVRLVYEAAMAAAQTKFFAEPSNINV